MHSFGDISFSKPSLAGGSKQAADRGERGCLAGGVAWPTPYCSFLAVRKKYCYHGSIHPHEDFLEENNTDILYHLVF